jgi:hypothetical protein
MDTTSRPDKMDYTNLRILMNNQDQFCCNQILQANNLIQMGKEEDAYEII